MKVERVIMGLLFIAATLGTVYAAQGDIPVSMQTSLRPIALTTATRYGTAIDLSAYTSAKAFLSVGAYGNGTHTVTWQKSQDNSNWSACANADFISAATTIVVDGTPDQSKIYEFQFKSSTRYLRPKLVSGSASTGVPATVFMLLSGARTNALNETDN